MKIRTLSEFQDALDAEMGWRIKEIAALKTSVIKNSGPSRLTLIRAGTALLYAHWEGFIKASAGLYISFLNGQRVKYSDLRTPFVVMGMKSHINLLSASKNYSASVAALDFIRTKMHERFGINSLGVINTESNLSSKVFSNIAQSLCLPVHDYETKFKFIDESLLERRNKIAHGEFIDIDADDWRTLADEVLVLLRNFKTDVENAASKSTFKAAP